MRRPALLALVAAVLHGAACGARPVADRPAPMFAGLQTVTVLAPGTARLSWAGASGDSPPITYEVYVASAAGEQNYAFPIARTSALQVEVSDLPGGALPTFFVVRARDARGNADENVVEKAATFAPNRLSLIARFPQPFAGDIAIDASGTIVAVAGFGSDPPVRATVFDVSNPGSPTVIATLYGPGLATDVEIHGGLLWVSTEMRGGGGVHAYDLARIAGNPPPVGVISDATSFGLGQCHTIWLEDEASTGRTILYCASARGDGAIHVVDVTDPSAPAQLSQVGIPGALVHDMYVESGLGVGCFLQAGWSFIDFADKSNPVLRQRVQYAGQVTHSAWPSADRSYLLTTDETTGGHLRIWDIRDRDEVVQVGQFVPDRFGTNHAIVHNVRVVGTLALLSHYEAGVQVLDVSDPARPVSIGWYDTFPGATRGDFEGDWGVTAHLPYLYVSDISTGLWIFRLD
jgi:choice-of-anchor B domain-containing protein